MWRYSPKRVFEKSRFCHISPTMFPHSSFQTAGANPGPRTVSLDLPGLFKHPLKGSVHETESTPLTGWMWLARIMTAVQRVCYALEAAVRSPLLFRFRAGFHCQIVDVVGRSHSRRNQGAAAVLAPEKTRSFRVQRSARCVRVHRLRSSNLR